MCNILKSWADFFTESNQSSVEQCSCAGQRLKKGGARYERLRLYFSGKLPGLASLCRRRIKDGHLLREATSAGKYQSPALFEIMFRSGIRSLPRQHLTRCLAACRIYAKPIPGICSIQNRPGYLKAVSHFLISLSFIICSSYMNSSFLAPSRPSFCISSCNCDLKMTLMCQYFL